MTCLEEKLKKMLMNFFFVYSILFMKIFKNQIIEEFKEQTQKVKVLRASQKNAKKKNALRKSDPILSC